MRYAIGATRDRPMRSRILAPAERRCLDALMSPLWTFVRSAPRGSTVELRAQTVDNLRSGSANTTSTCAASNRRSG